MEHPKNKVAKCIALKNIKSAVLEFSENISEDAWCRTDGI